jgi:hypothetical protein
MSANRGRGAMTATALVVTAAAFFLLGRGCVDAPTETRRVDAATVVDPSPVPDDAPRPQPPPTSPRKRVESTPTPSVAQFTPVVAADEKGAGVCPSIDVRVERADATPVADATVYALPAGATGDGVDNVESVPHAKTGADGRCKLTLPCDGRFDVGALIGDFASAAVVGVDVPTDALVRLAAPRMAQARFEIDSALLGRANQSLALQGSGPSCVVPGRGRRRRVDYGTSLHELPPSLSLPEGTTFSLRADDAAARGIVAEPSPFRAPASVRVHVDDRSLASVTISCSPHDARPTAGVSLRVDCRWDGEVESDDHGPWAWDVDFDSGKTLGDVVTGRFVARVPAKGATLRWSGAGVLDGSVRVEPGGRASFEVPLVLEIDKTALTEKDRVVALRATAPPGVTGDAEFYVDAVDRLWGESARGPVGEAVECSLRVSRAPAWVVVARRGDYVSDPCPLVADGETVVGLRAGGMLVLVPAAMPSNVGKCLLRRKDGSLLFTKESPRDDNPWRGYEFDVEPGRLIGPLPAGEVVFVVTLAGVAIREVRATVKAGAYEPLRIPMGGAAK